MLYKKKGLSGIEAVNRALQKLCKRSSNEGAHYDPDAYAIMKKGGLSLDESIKTIQLKKELDHLINAKELSGEDSSDGHNGMSPKTKEKHRYERKMKRRLQKVMGTLVERVDHSSSNSSSGSEEKFRLYNKKRKYNEYLEGI